MTIPPASLGVVYYNGSVFRSFDGKAWSAPLAAIEGATRATLDKGVLTLTAPDGTKTSYGAAVTPLPPPPPSNTLPVVDVAPGTSCASLAAALLLVADRGTIRVAPGSYPGPAHIDAATFPNGLTIIGAGAYKTILDGERGVGAGHRLAWGKGTVHITAPNVVLRGIGFINGGGGDNNSDGEAGVYSEQATGTLTIDACAFDGNENGIFTQNTVPVLLVQNCDFGGVRANGMADGRSHDIYTAAASVTETDCRHYNCANGHGLKARSKAVITRRNHYAHGGGRCVDIPDGTAAAWLSDGDTFTDLPGASANLIGYADESTANGTSGANFINSKIIISRFATVIWTGGGPFNFLAPKLLAVLDPSSPPPSLVLKGIVIGLPDLPPPVTQRLAPPPSPLI